MMLFGFSSGNFPLPCLSLILHHSIPVCRLTDTSCKSCNKSGAEGDSACGPCWVLLSSGDEQERREWPPARMFDPDAVRYPLVVYFSSPLIYAQFDDVHLQKYDSSFLHIHVHCLKMYLLRCICWHISSVLHVSFMCPSCVLHVSFMQYCCTELASLERACPAYVYAA